MLIAINASNVPIAIARSESQLKAILESDTATGAIKVYDVSSGIGELIPSSDQAVSFTLTITRADANTFQTVRS